jgi:hypothetical protein
MNPIWDFIILKTKKKKKEKPNPRPARHGCLSGRSSTCCEVGRCEVFGLRVMARDGNCEERLRDPRPGKKKKTWVCWQDPAATSGETQRRPCETRDPSSFFFLFYFLFNQLLHGLNFFLCIFFFSLGEVSTCGWWAKYPAFLPQPN